LEWVGFALSENTDAGAVLVVDSAQNVVYFRGPSSSTDTIPSAPNSLADALLTSSGSSSGGVVTQSSLPPAVISSLVKLANLPSSSSSSKVLLISIGPKRVLVALSSDSAFGNQSDNVWFEQAAALLRRWV